MPEIVHVEFETISDARRVGANLKSELVGHIQTGNTVRVTFDDGTTRDFTDAQTLEIFYDDLAT